MRQELVQQEIWVYLGLKESSLLVLDDDDEFTPERVDLFVANWDEKNSLSFAAIFIERYRDGKESKYYKKIIWSRIFNYKDMLFR